jgi:hypothetical protein
MGIAQQCYLQVYFAPRNSKLRFKGADMQQVISNITCTQALTVESSVGAASGPTVMLSQIGNSMHFIFAMSSAQAREAAQLLVAAAHAADLEADRRFKAGADAIDAAVQTSALIQNQAG